MMRLTLHRDPSGEKSTLGRLFIDGEFECFTLENPWKDNKRRISCIPEGEYEIKFRMEGDWLKWSYKRFPELHGTDLDGNPRRGTLELQDVPGRNYILIHWGNYPTDTQGCVLVGTGRGVDAVWRSQAAYKAFYPKIADPLSCGQRVTLEIKGAPIA
jgi:hypothetical protein